MRSSWALCILMALAVCAPAQQYQQALPGYRFAFPQDYFNHEDYQTEWWYYTGNMRAQDGHRFGFELTFFRQGVSRQANDNPWFVHDLWMAHMALSDLDGQRFHHEERLNRAGPGLAGVDAQSGLVWNGNWQAQIGPEQEELRGVGGDFSLALKLTPATGPVAQGQDGVSQKAAGMGHASHYFSLPRLLTQGTIEVGGKTFTVEGTSWMDHEFFTGGMAASESGWDWLSLQLQDGTELMLYRMRNRDGSIDPYSSGSFVDAQGKSRFLSARDFTMSPGTEVWTSAATNAAYPVTWHVTVPELKLELAITTTLRDQEMTEKFGPSYWEGAIQASGTCTGKTVGGVGYLEMTGYAKSGTAVIP